MRTLHRYFYRIFLPLLIVVAIGGVARFVMVSQFHDRNVAMSDAGRAPFSEVGARTSAETLPFSEENKGHVVAALQGSKMQLDRSLQEQESKGDVADAQQRAQELDQSIQELKTAGEMNWKERRDRAYQRLEAYANAVGRGVEKKSNS